MFDTTLFRRMVVLKKAIIMSLYSNANLAVDQISSASGEGLGVELLGSSGSLNVFRS